MHLSSRPARVQGAVTIGQVLRALGGPAARHRLLGMKRSPKADPVPSVGLALEGLSFSDCRIRHGPQSDCMAQWFMAVPEMQRVLGLELWAPQLPRVLTQDDSYQQHLRIPK